MHIVSEPAYELNLSSTTESPLAQKSHLNQEMIIVLIGTILLLHLLAFCLACYFFAVKKGRRTPPDRRPIYTIPLKGMRPETKKEFAHIVDSGLGVHFHQDSASLEECPYEQMNRTSDTCSYVQLICNDHPEYTKPWPRPRP